MATDHRPTRRMSVSTITEMTIIITSLTSIRWECCNFRSKYFLATRNEVLLNYSSILPFFPDWKAKQRWRMDCTMLRKSVCVSFLFFFFSFFLCFFFFFFFFFNCCFKMGKYLIQTLPVSSVWKEMIY